MRRVAFRRDARAVSLGRRSAGPVGRPDPFDRYRDAIRPYLNSARVPHVLVSTGTPLVQALGGIPAATREMRGIGTKMDGRQLHDLFNSVSN